MPKQVRPQITLQGLIDAAQALLAQGVPGDTPVESEGCDCYGGAVGLRQIAEGTEQPRRPAVLVERGEP